ncbi:MAG: ribonuclease M5 [Schwartzia sp. (in: firmicutes)]
MIKEVLVVEGKMDVVAIRHAVEADCLITGGFSLSRRALSDIQKAYERRGLIILTDPDTAGERIRRFLAKRFPEAKHAFIPREEATANDDVGVEQASPAAIRTALAKVRTVDWAVGETFTTIDMAAARLSGTRAAGKRRAKMGAALGVGYANAKTFLQRLNHYGVTRDEFFAALRRVEERSDEDAEA